MPLVRVRPGCRHGWRTQYQAGDVFEATEAELRSFGDKLELVSEPVASDSDPVPVVDATSQAVALAYELNVPLPFIEGSGQDGRILVSDVRAASEAMYGDAG